MRSGFPDDLGRRAGEFLRLDIRRPVSLAHDRGIERIACKRPGRDVAVCRALCVERRVVCHGEPRIECLRVRLGRVSVQSRSRHRRGACGIGIPAHEAEAGFRRGLQGAAAAQYHLAVGRIGRMECGRYGNGPAAEYVQVQDVGETANKRKLPAEPVFVPNLNRIAESAVRAAEEWRRIVQQIRVHAIAVADDIGPMLSAPLSPADTSTV